MSTTFLALAALLVVAGLAIVGARDRRKRRLAIEQAAKHAARMEFARIVVEETHRAIADPALSLDEGSSIVVSAVSHLVRMNDDGGLDAFIAEHEEALANALAEQQAHRAGAGR